ncbi:heterokaryon incompatibility protein-domain-containing protein [Xylogone sp. PMI_703]|nr:heterokaryon incompatibility protein-domain-containing protein [Xylogone sp. PMI_703]
MDWRRSGRPTSTTGTSLPQERSRVNHFRQRQLTSGNTSKHYNLKDDPVPLLHSVLGKRTQQNSRESSRDRNPISKRPRLKPVVEITNRASTVPENKSLLRLPNEIPLTIRDAIQVTKALGYRFLWVDKYCIDQSSETEKQQQCSRMGDIYAGSQLTIFALGSDSNYGLPGVSSRPRSWQRQCTTIGKYEFIFTMPDPHICISQSKWSTRGWTYQEGLLSTRRLFFNDYHAYFECNAMNCVETFKSNLKILYIETGQRVRAYHRAGKFVCGNSNRFSHLNGKQNKANHRKIDTIRRCQYHIQEYTKRELTNKDDVLNAFAGIARFYARTTAKIVSLAGIPIPFPIAMLGDIRPAHLDHLSYALAWTHYIHKFSEPGLNNPKNWPGHMRAQLPWTPYDNPKPQRRSGFPSWSWAGWFGEIELRKDLPYCWTSYLSSVQISLREDYPKDYDWLTGLAQYKNLIIQRLLTANTLYFDAYVLNPEKLKLWEKHSRIPSRRIPSKSIRISLSRGPTSLKRFHKKLMDRELECLVIGAYGEPRKDIFKAIQAADKKAPKARQGRIALFEREEPDAIICLIVHTVNKTSFRSGLLKIELEGSERESVLKAWDLGPKRSFMLK